MSNETPAPNVMETPVTRLIAVIAGLGAIGLLIWTLQIRIDPAILATAGTALLAGLWAWLWRGNKTLQPLIQSLSLPRTAQFFVGLFSARSERSGPALRWRIASTAAWTAVALSLLQMTFEAMYEWFMDWRFAAMLGLAILVPIVSPSLTRSIRSTARKLATPAKPMSLLDETEGGTDDAPTYTLPTTGMASGHAVERIVPAAGLAALVTLWATLGGGSAIAAATMITWALIAAARALWRSGATQRAIMSVRLPEGLAELRKSILLDVASRWQTVPVALAIGYVVGYAVTVMTVRAVLIAALSSTAFLVIAGLIVAAVVARKVLRGRDLSAVTEAVTETVAARVRRPDSTPTTPAPVTPAPRTASRYVSDEEW